MKKAIFAGVLALAVGASVGLAACGSGEETYTLHTPSLANEEYIAYTGDCPILINNGTGDESENYGMFGFENWAGQKMAVSDDGDLFDYGFYYDFSLTITENETEGYDYSFAMDIHVKGNGTLYTGEGDCVWTWTGSATKADTGYTLAAPTYGTIACTGTIKGVFSSTNYTCFPSTGYSAYNDGTNYSSSYESADQTDENDFADFGAKPEYLLKYFYGCTVVVEGESITGFTNVSYYTE